jgi:hypothetical protein
MMNVLIQRRVTDLGSVLILKFEMPLIIPSFVSRPLAGMLRVFLFFIKHTRYCATIKKQKSLIARKKRRY